MSTTDQRQNGEKCQTFKAKGHDAVLMRLQERGDKVEIRTINGDRYSGKVVARDRYTVSLDQGGRRAVIFKSAISALLF